MSKDKSFKISENLIIAALPAIAYLLAFGYQYGHANYFGVPFEFIAVDLTHVLILFVGIPSVFMMFSSFVNLIPVFKLVRQSALGVSIFRFFVMIALSLFFVKEYGWFAVLVVAIYVGFFEFIFPLITQRKHKGFITKLQRQEDLERAIDRDNHLLQNPGFLKFYFLLSLLVIVFVIFLQLGKTSAMNQKDFLVTEDGVAVLAIYGDTLIGSEFDEETKKITSDKFFINLGNKDQIKFQLITIGPLSIED